jgi:hypothetical protein
VAACTSRAPEPRNAAPSGVAAGTLPDGGAGVPSRVFLDPVSGQPREPTPAELAELARLERTAREAPRTDARDNAKPDAPAEFRLPDGTVGLRFPANASQPLQACLHPDGSVDEHCHAASEPRAPGPHGAEDDRGDAP